MGVLTRIGPADHGRPMTLEEFAASDSEEGFQYELIDGRLYASPKADLPQDRVDHWINVKLFNYALEHPEVINFVYGKARVFVPGRSGITVPQPDCSAYRDFPLGQDFRDIRWQDVSPVLVVEVLSLDDPGKDLVRNVELYHQVPSIKEYWILDARDDPNRPTMRAHARYGKRWRVKNLAFGDTYTTRLLPGFQLRIDPRR